MSSRSIRQASVLRHSALALALTVGLGGAGTALAQSTSGTIFGQATAGQTVTATSNSGVTRTVTVGQDGRYTISSLPVGTYNVSVMSGGATVSTRENVAIRVGAGTEVSFNAPAATAGNAQDLTAVTVSANTLPSIDISQVDSRTVITSAQLAKLPLARDAQAIAQLAPGVVAGSSDFTGPNGRALSSFGGAGVTENAYYINGMNVTDPLNGLGGIELPYGSIDQQEVLTGGYGAAYGRSDGGVINQVGKRGTNEWHFGAQILYTPKWARGTPRSTHYPFAYPGKNSGSVYQDRSQNKAWEAVESAYVGGPLIKDKLFMFASVEADRTEDTYTYPSASQQQTSRKYKDPKWYTKLDWNITDSHILELTAASTKHEFSGSNYEYDPDTSERGAFTSPAVSTKTSAKMWIAKYTGYITDDFTISAQYGKQVTDLYTDPYNPYADIIPINARSLDKENPLYTGGHPISNINKIIQVSDPSHQTRGANYRIDLTYKLGDHTITAGIDNQRTQDLRDSTYMAPTAGYSWQYGLNTNPNGSIANGVDAPANYPGGEDGYYVSKYIQSTNASVRVEQRAQYIEDTWQVSDRWLVKLGLRNDQFTNYNPEGNAFIRETKPQWAPRLGFSWDVFGDSTFKVYGNAGRYYLALPTSVALRGASGSLYTQEYYTYQGIDSNGQPLNLTPIMTANGLGVPYSANREFGQAPDPKTVTAKNLKAQSQDEYILGFDKALNDKYTFGMKATYRKLNRAIDDTCDTDVFEQQGELQGADLSGLRGCYFFNPGTKAIYRLPNASGGYTNVTITNGDAGFPHVKRKYYALDTYLEHPFDGTWWGRITYTFSKSYGNTEGQVKSDIGQDDIAATQDWDYPVLMEYAGGRQSNDHRHQIKAFGTWQINPEWNVSGILTMASGAPTSCQGLYGPDQTKPAYDGNYYHWCNGSPAPVGSAGDTPWTHIFSVNAEYRPSFADHKLAFNVNVYNLFNEQKPTRLNPDFSPGVYRMPQSWETPRYVRFGVTYDL